MKMSLSRSIVKYNCTDQMTVLTLVVQCFTVEHGISVLWWALQLCPAPCDPMDCNQSGSPLSAEFPGQEYWRLLPFPSSRSLRPGIRTASPVTPATTAVDLRRGLLSTAILMHVLQGLLYKHSLPMRLVLGTSTSVIREKHGSTRTGVRTIVWSTSLNCSET